MFQSIKEIAEAYGVSAKQVGQVLYLLGIRDEHHPVTKGFPFDQYITHGIARAVNNKEGEIRYYLYNIETVREEFERILTGMQKKSLEKKELIDSGNFLLERIINMQNLLSKMPRRDLLPEMAQIHDELAAMHQHLLNSDITLALPLNARAKRIYDAMHTWRRELAVRNNTPQFVILSNSVMHAVAYYQPENRDELLAIKGIGDKRANAYGEALLHIVRNSRFER